MYNQQILTSHILAMRKHYFNTSKKNFLDKSMFEELTLDCIGEHVDVIREHIEGIKKKREEKSGPYIYRYEPANKKRDKAPEYRFNNTSGNPIINLKNLRLV